ncbi:MAG: hypothetical protein BJ554DRAFT_8228 [Olpidium bornovanus]|uniref:Ras-GEF domain-containing protein n=1 Tax=Olpidium bornovanus TaxID=278681 RepID=A0A8H8A1V8_9FUNG|nr:MAG: hypothetical protein BJ554DRAFT_8228 [Olpidium bornovanus]
MQMAGAWKLLEPKHLLMFREIDRLLHPGDNYSNYRDRWSRALDSGSAAAPPGERGDGTDPAAKSGDAAPPSIPFLAAHIQLIWAIWSDPPPVDAGIVDGGRLAAVHRVVERLERERRHDWRASVPEDATANLLAHIDSVRPDTAETPAAAPSAAAAGGGGGFGASRRFGSALLLSAAGRAGKTRGKEEGAGRARAF